MMRSFSLLKSMKMARKMLMSALVAPLSTAPNTRLRLAWAPVKPLAISAATSSRLLSEIA